MPDPSITVCPTHEQVPCGCTAAAKVTLTFDGDGGDA